MKQEKSVGNILRWRLIKLLIFLILTEQCIMTISELNAKRGWLLVLKCNIVYKLYKCFYAAPNGLHSPAL